MFSPNPKNDPLLAAIKGVIAENDKHRDAVDRANQHFKITDKRQLPHNLHADYDKMLSESTVIAEKITKSTPMGDVIRDFEKSDAPQFEGKSMEKRRQMAIAAKMAMNEALKGNQHKIDANKNGKVDAQDFKMLRKMDEDVMTEAINNILEQDSFTTAEYNTLMESPFGDAFKAARASGSAEFTFGGKQYNSRQADETEDQWKANLEKNAPVPMPRNARPVSTPEPVARVATAVNTNNQDIATFRKADNASMDKIVPPNRTASDEIFDTDAIKRMTNDPVSKGPGPNYPRMDQVTRMTQALDRIMVRPPVTAVDSPVDAAIGAVKNREVVNTQTDSPGVANSGRIRIPFRGN